MSKTYIKEINIKKFRALNNLDINFSPNLNIICGQNGTSKSTILGVLAQICSFESEYVNNSKKSLNYQTIGGKDFKSKFSEHFRFSKVFDKPKTKNAPDYWDIGIKVHDGYTNEPLDNLKLDFTKRGNGLRLVLRGNHDRNITHPVIFLGLRRLFPISERKNYSKINFSYLQNPENKKKFIEMNSKILLKDHMSFYKNISSTNSKVAGSGAIPSSVVHGDNYDQDSVSIGEDNVGQIVMALESFKKLHDEYNSNYKGGLLLIDEVDAALFPAAQKRLIDVLKEYSETYNIQIVMTSHSPTMIQYLEKLGPNAGKIIPLFYEQGILKTGDKKFSEIESDLLAQLPINSSIKIRCYLEDSEASELFKAILNENDTGKRILNKKIEIMDVSMGSKNYIHLIDKGVPEFKDLSLVILDGDESSDNSTIIKLPFCVPPDQLLFEFLFILNNDDPFWAEINTSKQVFFNDFGKPVIQYFERNSQMNLLSLREKIQLKKGPERDRDLEDKAREIFKKFYKHSFIQGLLESENTNPFNELIKRKFDADQQSLSDFITKINDKINNKVKQFYQS